MREAIEVHSKTDFSANQGQERTSLTYLVPSLTSESHEPSKALLKTPPLRYFLVFNQTPCAARGVSFTGRGVSTAAPSSRKQQPQNSSSMLGSSPRAGSAWVRVTVHLRCTPHSPGASGEQAAAGGDQRPLGLGHLVTVF